LDGGGSERLLGFKPYFPLGRRVFRQICLALRIKSVGLSECVVILVGYLCPDIWLIL
jgi:hypothetical protein